MIPRRVQRVRSLALPCWRWLGGGVRVPGLRAPRRNPLVNACCSCEDKEINLL